MMLLALGLALQGDLVAEMEAAQRKAADKASASVVAIKVEREEAAPAPAPAAPRRSRGLFGRMPEDVFAKRPADAWCTGTIVEPDGLILTTHFNVSGKVKSIKVLLSDGRELAGKLVAGNASMDLAAVKVEASDLPVLAPAPMEGLRTGTMVVALGRGPDGKGLTANPGIVSAPSRLAGRGVQTDAKLNFGNVGGPVVDLEGRLVAISCKVDTKFSSSRGQNSGVGFAVAADRLAPVLADLKAGKSVAEARRAFLGIQADTTQSGGSGVPLSSVQAGGAAEKAGIKAGDVIVEIDGRKTLYFEDLRQAIARHAPGDKVAIKLIRGKENLEIECELGWAEELP